MHQIKIFQDIESNKDAIEESVNTWLADNHNIHIISITGNMAPQTVTAATQNASALGGQRFASSDIFIIIHYEKDA